MRLKHVFWSDISPLLKSVPVLWAAFLCHSRARGKVWSLSRAGRATHCQLAGGPAAALCEEVPREGRGRAEPRKSQRRARPGAVHRAAGWGPGDKRPLGLREPWSPAPLHLHCCPQHPGPRGLHLLSPASQAVFPPTVLTEPSPLVAVMSQLPHHPNRGPVSDARVPALLEGQPVPSVSTCPASDLWVIQLPSEAPRLSLDAHRAPVSARPCSGR